MGLLVGGALVEGLGADLQVRDEDQFVWANAVSMYQLLPNVLGFWPMSNNTPPATSGALNLQRLMETNVISEHAGTFTAVNSTLTITISVTSTVVIWASCQFRTNDVAHPASLRFLVDGGAVADTRTTASISYIQSAWTCVYTGLVANLTAKFEVKADSGSYYGYGRYNSIAALVVPE
jgi:hypothetical protein